MLEPDRYCPDLVAGLEGDDVLWRLVLTIVKQSRPREHLMAGVVWPSRSRSRTVDLDGRVHLTDYGDPDAADLIVCLHGLGGSALNFGLVAPLLAEGRRVLVPDLLGHGRSFATAPEEPAVEAQLQMLSQLLARETERPVILLGHSMGGILAMLHAVRLPKTVESMVLLDPPVPNLTRWTRDPRLTAKLALLRLPGVSALVARQVAHMTPEQLVARQLTAATPHSDQIPQAAIDATVKETRATRGDDGGHAAQRAQFRAILDVVELLARPTWWRQQLAGITTPTLWLHGADDPLSDLEAARVLAATRPEWTFRIQEGVGHLPHLEDPAGTARCITGWLDEQASRRALPARAEYSIKDERATATTTSHQPDCFLKRTGKPE
jgi:pimeloyl-ACP methyl ester carboxylesterase